MERNLFFLRHLFSLVRYWIRFRAYNPQPVTLKGLMDWLFQFPPNLRPHILSLLGDIKYLTETEVRESLLKLNEQILSKLSKDGISIENVIYVSIDAAGSSSSVMLNMLRDAANLERRKANLIDSHNTRKLNELTDELTKGAIIYVDDCSMSGKQFVRNQRRVSEYIVGAFSEFFIVPLICEEAENRIQPTGVATYPAITHLKNERPLHDCADMLDVTIKEELIGICRELHKKHGRGFGKLATMAVLYRNAPNTTPLLFRGSIGQKTIRGILPRSDDLPIPVMD